MKRGVLTSEFWISLLALVWTGLLAVGVVPHADALSAAVSAVAAALVAFGYSWARAFVKAKPDG